MTAPETPAARLRQLLDEREQTQAWLAQATGIDRSKVNGYTTGRERLGPTNAGRIEDAFGVPRGYLGVTRERVARDAELWSFLERLDQRMARIEEQLDLDGTTKPPRSAQGGRRGQRAPG